jgi:hypothetical protein
LWSLINGWHGFLWGQTDDDGRFTLTGLLSDVKLSAAVESQLGFGMVFEKRLLKPGESVNLGEIKVKFIRD